MKSAVRIMLVLLFLYVSVGKVSSEETSTPILSEPIKNLVSSQMECREIKRPSGELMAFFGFFHDTCLDVLGKRYVYVTGFDFMNGKSPAKESGLEIRDRIISISGCPVTDSAYLTEKMKNFTATNAAMIDGQDDEKIGTVYVTTLKLIKPSEGRRKKCADIGLRDAK